jgi:hypothetical protein
LPFTAQARGLGRTICEIGGDNASNTNYRCYDVLYVRGSDSICLGLQPALHRQHAECLRIRQHTDASGKETGLGNEAQVHIVLSATAQCINNGGKNPKAGNKTNVAGAGDFPVQNGTPTSA